MGLNCWFDLSFPSVRSFSSCVSLPCLLQKDCSQDWIPQPPPPTDCEDTLAGQMISVVLTAPPILLYFSLAGAGTSPGKSFAHSEPLPFLLQFPQLQEDAFLPRLLRMEPACELEAAAALEAQPCSMCSLTLGLLSPQIAVKCSQRICTCCVSLKPEGKYIFILSTWVLCLLSLWKPYNKQTI